MGCENLERKQLLHKLLYSISFVSLYLAKGSITLIRAETERNDIVRFSKETTNFKVLASGTGFKELNLLGESNISGEL